MAGKQRKLTSIFETVGDFVVSDKAEEKAQEQMGERTARSQRRDRRERAPVTTNYSKWKQNADHWDFPGVDTPRQDPRVMPKDLKHSEKPRTTDPDTGGRRAARTSTPQSTASSTDAPVTETAQLSSMDISLSPDEVFNFTGAVDPQALGGNDEVMGGERSPFSEPETPPDIARGENPFDDL